MTLVLCVDEKSQIQALDRTQAGLLRKRGRSQTLTRDYKCNGTAILFAALNAANGEVYGLCQERHRHQEWLKFLSLLDETIPAHLDLHATTTTLSPSSGRLAPPISWKRSSALGAHCINVNLHDALH